MKKYEGEVRKIRVNDTGESSDFDYEIGDFYLNQIVGEIMKNKGKKIKVTIEVLNE